MKKYIYILIFSVLSFGVLLPGQAAVTDIATVPVSATTTSQVVLPNIMFVLDDSTSMEYDYMPDWANPFLSLPYLFANPDYNGLGYNPSTYYSPPVMFNSSGLLDASVYKSQTAGNSNDWKEVKDDGFGVQTTAKSNLVGKAIFYTTVAGEYCDSPQLRNCKVASAADGDYKYEAKLRWCNTAEQAFDTTVNANPDGDVTRCQKTQIASTVKNTAAGIRSYTFARTPSVNGVAKIVFAGEGSINVSNIKVNGYRIIANAITGEKITAANIENIKGLLTSVVNNINACTSIATGSCTVAGYSASSDNVSTVFIAAPATVDVLTSVTTPEVVTAGAPIATATKFSKNVPGSIIKTEIKAATTTYPYPNTTAKATTRIDCAGTTCTYDEEMTNYANWWAYYHTRMQTMKSGASIAFSSVTDQYRVGYFSINNATNSFNSAVNDYLDIDKFTGSHKYQWYNKFLSAAPKGGTPLRQALANAGQIYAGTRSTLYNTTVTDPMLYSCQQNFTILSTDGYWNDSVDPKQADNSTDIGQQDHNDDRPYYDGSTVKRLTSQTLETKTKTLKDVYVNQKKTIQLQSRTNPLTQVVTTVTHIPFRKTIYKVQSKTNKLKVVENSLTSTESFLYTIQQKYQKRESILQQTNQLVQKKEYTLKKTTYSLTQNQYLIKKVTAPVVQTETFLKRYTYPLQLTETLLVQTVSPLQKRTRNLNTDTNLYGNYTGWSDVTSGTCVVNETNGAAVQTQCQYLDESVSNKTDVDTCAVVAPSSGSPYSVLQRKTCSYKTVALPTANATATCVNRAQSSSTTAAGTYYSKRVCAYSNTATTQSSLTSCSNNAATVAASQTSGTYGDLNKITCDYTGGSTPTTLGKNPTDTCTLRNQTSGPNYQSQISCAYATNASDLTTESNQSACSAIAGNTSNTNGAVYAPSVTCTYQTTAVANSSYPKTGLTSCAVTNKTDVSAPQLLCSNGGVSGTPLTGQPSCVYKKSSGTVDGNTWAPQEVCEYEAASPTTYVDIPAPGSCTKVSKATSTNNNTSYPLARDCQTKATTETAANATGTCTVVTAAADTSTVLQTKVSCSYSDGVWENVTPGTCSAIAKSPGPTSYSVLTSRECQYNDTGTAVKSTAACDSSGTGATRNRCYYVAQTPATNQATCDPVPASTAPNWTGLTARTCVYEADSTKSATGGNDSCLSKAKSTNADTRWLGPARTCSYVGFTTFADSNVACVPRTDATIANNTNSQSLLSCQYVVSTAAADAQTCTTSTNYNSTTSTFTDYTVINPVTCTVPTDTTDAPVTHPANCTPGETYQEYPALIGWKRVTTTCSYDGWGSWTNLAATSCTPSVPSSSTTTANVKIYQGVECRDNAATATFVDASECTASGTYPTIYDSGKIITCAKRYVSQDQPIAKASCNNGEQIGNEITTCKDETVQNAKGVQTCTAGTATTSPYTKTTCDPQSSDSRVSVSTCVAQVASEATQWKSVSCVDPKGPENTLADVAQYYYKTDIRTEALGSKCASPSGQDLCSNDDGSSSTATIKYQHMNTYTLGMGASGYMQYAEGYATNSADYLAIAKNNLVSALPKGVCAWQTDGLCNWPEPISDDQSGIDDLWHAGVNGRGAYFSAGDPTSLANGIADALAGVAATKGASAAAATSNPNVYANDNYIFSTTFTTVDWVGELVRKQISITSGAIRATDDWSAQTKLDEKTSSRLIYTFDSTKPAKIKEFTVDAFKTNTNFLAAHISDSASGLTQIRCNIPTNCLSDTDKASAAGANLVGFLRGERSNEGANNNKYYRVRKHVLGDIVNSEAVYVSAPRYGYADPGYNDFTNLKAARLPVVYAGANDGMLHAFRAKGSDVTEAALTAVALDTTSDPDLVSAAATAMASDIAQGIDGGQELWAYIPTAVMPNLYKLADKSYSTMHQYYVDGTPVSGDICIDGCGNAATAVWKTILVGGLNRGGRSYYAMDITDPNDPKGMWEFTNTNLGYSYSNPTITKLADGTWVVLVASGYNNIPGEGGATGGDGKGYLFVINATTGALINTISTGVGSEGSPSGLTRIAAQVINPTTDNTVIAAYGGDLEGNVWRFDVNNNIGASGYDAQLLVQLKDSSGNAQPITSKPQVGIIDNSTVIFVGTGKYLALSDVTTVNTQSVYAIKDTKADSSDSTEALYNNPHGSDSGFVKQEQQTVDCPDGTAENICTSGQQVRTSTNHTVNFATANGWYFDLPDAGERVNTDIELSLGLLGINTNTPNSEPCVLDGYSYSYFIDYRSGGPVATSTTNVIASKLGNELASKPVFVRLPDGTVVQISGMSGGGLVTTIPPKAPFTSITRRTSWRELIEE